MENWTSNETWTRSRSVFGVALTAYVLLLGASLAKGQTDPAPKMPPVVGTVKALDREFLVLTVDSGRELRVQLPSDVKVVCVPPGSKDLKEAVPIELSELQAGDRILVRGRPGDDASSLIATTVIAMKKAQITEKQAKDREEWQRHGIGGLVKSMDRTTGSVTISTLTAAGPKDVVIHATKETVVRRYAPGSIKFDEAKTASLTDLHDGDQLRARGNKSADGSEFTADEIVSGSFRNIAGTIVAVEPSTGTMTVSNIADKKQVELKVTADSQMRKLPQPMAQRIAMRLKGTVGDANARGSAAPSGQEAATASAGGGPGGSGQPQRSGGGDMQQMLSRLPVSQLSDFQKGDAVMIVATPGQDDRQTTVITLLGGVEPILQSSTQGQAASMLSPWSLSQGGGGDAGTP